MKTKKKQDREAPLGLRLHKEYKELLLKKAQKRGLTLHAICIESLTKTALRK